MKFSMRALQWLIVVALAIFAVVILTRWSPSESSQIVYVTLTPSSTVPPTVVPTWTVTPVPEVEPSPTASPTRTPLPTRTPVPLPTTAPPPLVLPDPPPLHEPEGEPLNTTLPFTLTGPQGIRWVTDTVPMAQIAQPPRTVNILLLGSDRRPGEAVGRTDVLMIVSIFPDLPGVSMISIPRDFYAWIPGWGYDKINTAYLRASRVNYEGGGPALLRDTIEYNFGIPIHAYAMVDFASFRSIVDTLGGVDVVVECSFHDTYPDDESPTGQTDIDLLPGIHHLDGKHALWYSRSRWNTSDYDRHRRQQQVIRAMYTQALNQNLLPRVPELWDAYQQWVETDLRLNDLLSLGGVAARLDTRNIKSRFIRGAALIEAWTAPNGGFVLVPNRQSLQAFMEEAAQPPVTSRASQRAYRVEVLNGSGNSGWGHVAAYRLGLEGFEVVDVQPAEGAPRTTIVDFTTTGKGSPIYTLMRLYKRQDGDVQAQPTEGSPIDFRVILGWDYNPCDAAGPPMWQPAP